jgi:ABC-type sugar transport system, periplasmic component
MKRILSCALLAAMAALAFAAGPSKDAVTLRFSWWGSDGRHQATLAAIKAFEAKNPGIKVEAEYGGWDGYYQKLVTQLAGGTMPDLMQIDQPWVNELSAKGDVFLSLDASSGVDLSGFDASYLKDFCSYKGQVKGLPTGLNGTSFLIDKDVLVAAGIDPKVEWTWDTMLSEGAKVHKKDAQKYFLNMGPAIMSMYVTRYINQMTGGVFIGEDRKLQFTKEQAKAAFEYFQKWYDQGVVIPASSSILYNNKEEENPAWINGQTACMFTWASAVDKIRGSKANVIIKAEPVMVKTANSGILVRPSQVFAVSKTSAHPKETLAFLNFLCNDPDGILALGSSRGVPPTVKARALLKEKKLIPAEVEQITNIALANRGKPQTSWAMNSEIGDIISDVVEQFAFGKLSPEKAASDLVTRIQSKLASL